jgi:aquaporin Z
LLAEFIGTFALVAVGVAAVLNASNEATDLLGVALAHGLVIAVMVTAVGHVTGGHFNPAVTTAFLALGKLPPITAVAYIATQLLGGVLGALFVREVMDILWVNDYAQVALNPDLATWQGLALEALGTFFLVWVVLAVAVDKDGAWFRVAGLPIGFVITFDILMFGPMTGAAMNPARWLGPNLITGHWTDALVWIVGPLAGAIAAAFAYMYVVKPREVDEA